MHLLDYLLKKTRKKIYSEGVFTRLEWKHLHCARAANSFKLASGSAGHGVGIHVIAKPIGREQEVGLDKKAYPLIHSQSYWTSSLGTIAINSNYTKGTWICSWCAHPGTRAAGCCCWNSPWHTPAHHSPAACDNAAKENIKATIRIIFFILPLLSFTFAWFVALQLIEPQIV